MTVSVKVDEQDNPCHTKLDSIGFQKQTISHQELSRVQHNSHFSLHHHKNLWKNKSDMVLTKFYEKGYLQKRQHKPECSAQWLRGLFVQTGQA